MFDESSTKGLDSFFNFPEWQFIQYILPCFVTLIGQHATNPRSKPNELLAYTRFVHNLIQGFESNLIYKMGRGEPSLLIVTRFRDTPEAVWINLAKNLTVQLQEVESELGMLMYGSQKRMKRADEAEVLQAQIFFRMLKETLKSTTIERGEPIVFSGWGETLMRLIPRMKIAIQKEVMLPTNPFPTNNLLRAMEIMQELTNLADICNNPEELDDAREILDLASQKLKIMLGKQQSAVRDTMDKKKYQEMQKLTVQQLLGFVLFLLVFKRNANMLPFLQETKSPRHSSGNLAAYNYAEQTWVYLKAAMQPLLSDKQGNYLAWVTIDFVKKWMPISDKLFTILAEKNDLKDELMHYSLPTIPIKYCWGCDKFEGLEIKMTMCKLCVENRAVVHDIYWFCSCECEEKVLAERHLEEHNLFLERKLGRMSI
jgi:hypothetical protein